MNSILMSPTKNLVSALKQPNVVLALCLDIKHSVKTLHAQHTGSVPTFAHPMEKIGGIFVHPAKRDDEYAQ